MISLTLKNFKAFQNELNLELDQKNVLIYGENGAGKSSIYESLKLIFYNNKLTNELTAATPEEQANLISDFLSNYNNKVTNSNFEIFLNGIKYSEFDKSTYQVFMFSSENIKIENNINLKEIIREAFLPVNDIDEFCNQASSLIEQEINQYLDEFNESISVSIDREDNFNYIINDNRRGLNHKFHLKKFYNEGKINLIVILSLLSVIICLSDTDSHVKRLLIIDDFVTSIDIPNRKYLLNYILKEFNDMQIVLMTHNISFYNMAIFLLKEFNTLDSWLLGNIYEIGTYNKFYVKSNEDLVSNIKKDFYENNHNVESIGNRIRQRFEVLLYEFSKLIMIGAVEDSKKLISRIQNGKSVYYNSTRSETASDLIDAIYLQLNNGINHNLKGRLNKKINEFKNDDFPNFKNIVDNLRIYQKITMHPLSHGNIGLTTFSVKEIEVSIELLNKLENSIKDFVNNDLTRS